MGQQMSEIDIAKEYLFDSDSSEESFIFAAPSLLSSTSCSSSDDNFDTILHVLHKKFIKTKRNCIKNYFEDVVPQYSDQEFIKHFRINKQLWKDISKEYKDSEGYKSLTKNYRVKCAEFHILVFLWYAGHEAAGYHDIGDRFDIAIAIVHSVIKRVAFFISGLSERYIKWPDARKMRETAQHYLSKNGFPGVLGCIDGTHIVINPPKESKDEYINRKGDVAIHMQGVCDENKRFINVFIGYPSSVHDARVFQNSDIYSRLPHVCNDQYLLGDSAYPCTNFTITPYRDNGHLTAAQKRFNIKHSSCRVTIEHTFGILKQRFRQLYYCKIQDLQFLCHFIRSCCVLHNMSHLNEIQLFTEPTPNDEQPQDDGDGLARTMDSAAGRTLRDRISQHLGH